MVPRKTPGIKTLPPEKALATRALYRRSQRDTTAVLQNKPSKLNLVRICHQRPE